MRLRNNHVAIHRHVAKKLAVSQRWGVVTRSAANRTAGRTDLRGGDASRGGARPPGAQPTLQLMPLGGRKKNAWAPRGVVRI